MITDKQFIKFLLDRLLFERLKNQKSSGNFKEKLKTYLICEKALFKAFEKIK